MFETNTDNNSGLISLARAAQLTGYHQDYLGQLCRLGKLEAQKVGRNWFTSEEALNNLSASAAASQAATQEVVEEVPELEGQDTEQEVDQDVEDFLSASPMAPVISENITINEVDGMPIAIRTVPLQVRNTNSVQNLLTNLRIESLQQEVLELRKLLFRLMEEVKSHTNILQTRETVNRVQDSLKHSYISSFDFSAPQDQAQISAAQERIEVAPLIWEKPKRSKYTLMHWVAATAAVAVIAFIGLTAALTGFLGTNEQVTSISYPPPTAVQENRPEVAGAESSAPQTLPTDSSGELIPIMIR